MTAWSFCADLWDNCAQSRPTMIQDDSTDAPSSLVSDVSEGSIRSNISFNTISIWESLDATMLVPGNHRAIPLYDPVGSRTLRRLLPGATPKSKRKAAD